MTKSLHRIVSYASCEYYRYRVCARCSVDTSRSVVVVVSLLKDYELRPKYNKLLVCYLANPGLISCVVLLLCVLMKSSHFAR